MTARAHPLKVFRTLDWWLVLVSLTLVLVGLVFIHSATRYDPMFVGQHNRQALFVLVSAGLGAIVVMIPYPRIMRFAWVIYAGVVVALLLIPFFGTTINGARRWFMLPGFAIQPSEFAKLAVIFALAGWLRFRSEGRLFDNVVMPLVITLVPALMVMRQPDLGSAIVFCPIVVVMAYSAGASLRHLFWAGLLGAVVVLVAYVFLLEDYQLERISAWQGHFAWQPEVAGGEEREEIRNLIRGPAYQPWQSLIAIGSGGWLGFGVGEGPQNRYDFVPYRNADYIFSVVAEETGLLGVIILMCLQLAMVLMLMRIASRSRERFGRILVVGVATFLGSQTLMHIAVCAWLVPSTGLPLPLMSYGGSSTMVTVLALAMALNVGARRQPVVASDAFR